MLNHKPDTFESRCIHIEKITRVACLYRVSTHRQTDGGDIPMQKNACRSFAQTMPGWRITKEYTEKGVSGYHKSAEQRNILQKMIQDAENGWFDILLVFMFDRLGRREDETTVMVEWLDAKGIEIWSVKEGRQRFDNRGDKLINYIRYWQSGGESEKTSVRVAEKHRQLVEAGKFRGGPPPYGYDLVYSGEYNRRGHERKKMVVNQTESGIVKIIYSLYTEEEYGSYKIARYLNERKIPSKNGLSWTVQAIVRLLKNPIYKGDYVSGKVKNQRGKKEKTEQDNWFHSRERLSELTIVDEKTWTAANDRINGRRRQKRSADRHTVPLSLSGIVFCGHCGTKMTFQARASHRANERTGETVTYLAYAYCCPKKMRQGACDGQYSYSAQKAGALVTEEMRNYLEGVNQTDQRPGILHALKGQLDICRKESILTAKALRTAEAELQMLNDEIIKCLTGESIFTSEQLTQRIISQEGKLNDLLTIKQQQSAKTHMLSAKKQEILACTHIIPDWRHVFDAAEEDKKVFLIKTAIGSIHIYRDSVDIRFAHGISW